MISPFFKQDRIAQNDEFQICLQLPPPAEDLSGIVEPPESLKNPHHMLKGYVDKTGGYDLMVRLRGQDKKKRITGKFSLGHTPQCEPFRIYRDGFRVTHHSSLFYSRSCRDWLFWTENDHLLSIGRGKQHALALHSAQHR